MCTNGNAKNRGLYSNGNRIYWCMPTTIFLLALLFPVGRVIDRELKFMKKSTILFIQHRVVYLKNKEVYIASSFVVQKVI